VRLLGREIRYVLRVGTNLERINRGLFKELSLGLDEAAAGNHPTYTPDNL